MNLWQSYIVKQLIVTNTSTMTLVIQVKWKNSSIYSQGLQIKRLGSGDHKLQKHLENHKNWFCERGYPGGLID